MRLAKAATAAELSGDAACSAEVMDQEFSTRTREPKLWRGPAGEAAFFVALMATALALGGALAHAYELPNKIGLSREQYFIVQQIYAGWNQLAYVLLVQLFGILAVLWTHWGRPRVTRPAFVALAGLLSAQAVFWTYTAPANGATGQWTIQPENWEQLRAWWEYSHLAGAVLQLVTMAALITAVLRR